MKYTFLLLSTLRLVACVAIALLISPAKADFTDKPADLNSLPSTTVR